MLRNGPEGYGSLTKALHWATVLALVAQFTVGYLMDPDDEGGAGAVVAGVETPGVVAAAVARTRATRCSTTGCSPCTCPWAC